MTLETYQRKRDFARTPEPEGKRTQIYQQRFVVQEHHASRLHYDFRLEMGGVLKSWAIPKGPSLNPHDKRLAVMVEDHPVDYIDFEGHIADGNYGAGEVMIWDFGDYELAGREALAQLEAGKLSFRLYGDKLKGEFHLVRLRQQDKNWLLIKGQDEFADPDWELEPLRPLPEAETSPAVAEEVVTPVTKLKPVRRPSVQRSPVDITGKPMPAAKAFKAKALNGDITVSIDRQAVSLTSLDRVYWPEEGHTKGDLIRYYFDVAKYSLPYLKDRPLILKRYPNGVEQPSFYQHDVNDVPDFVHTFASKTEEGRVIDYVVCQDRATLLYLANLGAVAQNPWHSRVHTPDCPDWIVFDLDPGRVEFSTVCAVALALKEALDQVGLEACAKTSGSTGLHVYVPIKPVYPYEQVADFAERVAQWITRERPDLSTLERSKQKRPPDRVYVDYQQNARGKSVVAPYSVRARSGATVSAPLSWKEVQRAPDPRTFTLRSMPRRLAKTGDLLRAVLSRKQNLERAIGKLDKLSKRSPGR